MRNKKLYLIILTAIMLICFFVGCRQPIGDDIIENDVIINAPTTLQLKVGESYIFDNLGVEQQVSFDSKDTNIVTVSDDGAVYAVNSGITFIVISAGDLQTDCLVTVTESVYSVRLDFTEVNITVGGNHNLSASVFLDGVSINDTVQWKGYDSEIITVDVDKNNAIITAKKAGNTTLVCEIGKSKAICTIKVVSDGAVMLQTPQLTVSHCDTVSWEAVTGARAYALKINNGNWIETTETSYNFSEFADRLVDYKVSVRALAKTSNGYYDGNYSTLDIKHSFNVEVEEGNVSCMNDCTIIKTCQICNRAETINNYYGEHKYIDGKCAICDKAQTEGLVYVYDQNNDSYKVIGVNSSYLKTNGEIYVRKFYDDNINGEKKVTTIDVGAFKNLIHLKKVVLPDSVTKINNEAFYSCTSLIEIRMLGVSELSANNALYRCVSLERIIVSDNFTLKGSVLNIAHTDATGYTPRCDVLVYGDKSSNISIAHTDSNFGITGKIAYYSDKLTCSSVTWKFDSDGNVVYMNHAFVNGICSVCGAHDDNGIIYVYDDSLNGYKVLGVGNGFTGTVVVVPKVYNDGINGEKEVVAVADNAFISGQSVYGCSITLIETICLPETVTQLGKNVFKGAINLKHIEIPGVINIKDNVFENCRVKRLVVNSNAVLSGKVCYLTDYAFAYDCDLYVYGAEKGSSFNIQNDLNNNFLSESVYFYSSDFSCGTWSFVNGKAQLNAHNYKEGVCIICGCLESKEIIYAFNNEGYYEVVGLTSSSSSKNLVIPTTYDDGVNGRFPVNYVHSGAFINNTNLTSVVMTGIKSIGWNAFRGCKNIVHIDISGCTFIDGKNQFKDCDSLASLLINANLRITGQVFNTDDVLLMGKCLIYVNGTDTGSSFDLDVTNNNLFRSAYLKVSANPEAECERWYIVDGEYKITEHKYEDGVCSICGTAEEYSYDLLLGGYILKDFIEEDFRNGVYIIPNKINGFHGEKYVVGIADGVFAGNTSLIEVRFSDKLVSIGKGAFENCTALAGPLSFGAYSNIGSNAFKGCSSLKGVQFQEGTTIGDSAFEGCASIEELRLPKLASLGNRAFYACTKLKTVIFPKGAANVFEIGNEVFAQCTGLKLLSIQNTKSIGTKVDNVNIGNDLFYNCISLETIIVSNYFNVVGRQFAVEDNENYVPKAIVYIDRTTITTHETSHFSDGSTGHADNVILTGKAYINNNAADFESDEFGRWKYVDGIPVGNSHPFVGTKTTNKYGDVIYKHHAHPDYMKLEECVFENNVCTICGFYGVDENGYQYNSVLDGYVLVDGSKISATRYDVPSKYTGEMGEKAVISIAKNAFKGNDTIQYVSFPAGITINESAFDSCTSLKEAKFAKVSSIGAKAFQYCSALEKVEFPQGKENYFPIGDNAFGHCSNLKYLYIQNISDLGVSGGHGRDIFYDCVGLEVVVVGNYFRVTDPQFRLPDDIQKAGYTPKAVVYCDLSVNTAPGNEYKFYNGLDTDQTNVILSGRVFINGLGTKDDITYVDGITEGTWKIENNIPKGIKHAFVGSKFTNKFGVVVYKYHGLFSKMNIEESCTFVNNFCIYCGAENYVIDENGYQYNDKLDGYVLASDENFTRTSLVIPATYNGSKGEKPVVAVGNEAFMNNATIETITFPAGIAIGEKAFYNCDAIKELNFPKLASIGMEAFRGCDGVLKVIFPDGIENNFPIGEAAFRECTNMKLLSIRNKATLTVANDGDSIFYDCIGLEAIMVGSYFHTATAGENQIFGVSSSIQNAGYIPKATIYVDASIDTNPGQPAKVNIRGAGANNVIPSGRIYVIGMSMNADKLGRVGGGTYTIGADGMPVGVGHAWVGREGQDNDTANTNGITVYYYNAQLSWYNIQEPCDEYYENGKCTVCGAEEKFEVDGIVYQYNADLDGYVLTSGANFTGTSLVIPATCNGAEGEKPVVAVADKAFMNNATIETITFPAGIAIGERAFYNCDAIKELNFPKLASIGKEAFRGCDGVLKVIFPDGIENNFPIGEAAFRECKNMKLLSIRNKATLTVANDGDSIFFDCIGLEAIMVGSYFRTDTAGGNQIFGVTNSIQQAGYIPKATIYVDASIDTNPGQPARVSIRGAGQTNVIPSGRIYVIGMSMNADKLGRVGGTYTIGADGMPVGVGHAWIGRQGEDNDTANTNGVTVYFYNQQLSWYNIQEPCDEYYEDGKCTVCGSSQPE